MYFRKREKYRILFCEKFQKKIAFLSKIWYHKRIVLLEFTMILNQRRKKMLSTLINGMEAFCVLLLGGCSVFWLCIVIAKMVREIYYKTLRYEESEEEVFVKKQYINILKVSYQKDTYLIKSKTYRKAQVGDMIPVMVYKGYNRKHVLKKVYVKEK